MKMISSRKKCFFLFAILFTFISAAGQIDFIHARNGRPIILWNEFINNCLHSLNKTRSNKEAVGICECRGELLDYRFSMKDYDKHTTRNVINFDKLIKSDTALAKKMDTCFIRTGRTLLLQLEVSDSKFVSNCMRNLETNRGKTIDAEKREQYCRCQLELVKEKRIADAQIETLNDPNSLLTFEFMYKCGTLLIEEKDVLKGWDANATKDITGPASDTVNVLVVNGMTFVKVKIGSLVRVWLLDSGASVLFINTDMETTLKKEGRLSEAGYLGIGEYELANGEVERCRRYLVNQVQIGEFSVDNIIIAVSEKSKSIIVGKSLLNKFSTWALDNSKNKLILTR
jgi:hypothetical protein